MMAKLVEASSFYKNVCVTTCWNNIQVMGMYIIKEGGIFILAMYSAAENPIYIHNAFIFLFF